jgi:hypothetical protein
MAEAIPQKHPLRQLFTALVERTFEKSLGLREPEVSQYVAALLAEFVHIDRVYRLRDAGGKRLEEVGEMLLEGDLRLNATSFDREREVHKHVGDFTLFWTGVYPEAVRRFRAAGRRDELVDYVSQGKKSYAIAASFDHGPYRSEAPVLRQLSEQFELCMFGLSLVRRELDTLRDPHTQAALRLLDA